MKHLLVFSIFILASSCIAAQVPQFDEIFNDQYFHPSSALIPTSFLKEKNFHFVECHSACVGFNLAMDTCEHYYASFDSIFRISSERYVSNEGDSIETTFTYLGESAQSITKRFFRYNENDKFLTLDEITKISYKNGVKISKKTEKFSKVVNLNSMFIKFDTIIYNEINKPIRNDQRWINKYDTMDVDTLRTDYTYNSEGKLTKINLHPVGKFSSVLRANNGCIEPFIYTIIFEKSELKYGPLPNEYIMKDIKSENGIIGHGEFYDLIAETKEAKISKVNNNYYYLNVDLYPGHTKLEAKKQSVRRTDYIPNTLLPNVITQISDYAVYIYNFNYSTTVPSGF